MNKIQEIKNAEPKKTICINGTLYFNKETERKFFFFLTVIMLLMGLVIQLV